MSGSVLSDFQSFSTLLFRTLTEVPGMSPCIFFFMIFISPTHLATPGSPTHLINLLQLKIHSTHSLITSVSATEHHIYMKQNCTVISPFHDSRFFANRNDGISNMVALDEREDEDLEKGANKQNIKEGRLRHLRTSSPHNGYIWSCGASLQVRVFFFLDFSLRAQV